MFREAKPFNGFPERGQGESVPSLLLALVSMILTQHQRPDGRDNSSSTCSCPNIEVPQHQAQVDTWHIISQSQAQNCTGDTSSNIHRDDVAAHICKRALIDRLLHLGISVSYHCVLQLSTEMGRVSANSFTESKWSAHQQRVAECSQLLP